MDVKYEGIACYNVEVNLEKSHLSEKYGKLILESDPVPDYYARAHFPPSKHLGSWRLFLILDKHIDCFQDIVLRKAYMLKNLLPEGTEISPGQINFGKQNHLCVRINTLSTDVLDIIIPKLKEIGLEFLSNKKMPLEKVQLFYKKHTEMVQLQEGVLRDKDNAGRYFFEIDKLIELQEFKDGVVKIKNNCDFHLFDTFLSFMFINGKGQDFIGVYSDHCDENRFTELQNYIQNLFN
jgi:hypothetical protein